MKMTYSDIISKHSVLMKIGEHCLPRRVRAAIARNLVKLEDEIKLYTKQKAEIVETYAKKDEKGNPLVEEGRYTFDDSEKESAFIAETKELNEVEFDIEVMKFRASELDRCDEEERYDILNPVQEASISWMIDYEEEEL